MDAYFFKKHTTTYFFSWLIIIFMFLNYFSKDELKNTHDSEIEFALALNGVSSSERWDWPLKISRGTCKLARISGYKKNTHDSNKSLK